MTSRMNIAAAVLVAIGLVGGLCAVPTSVQASWTITSAAAAGGTANLPLRAGGLVLADFDADGQIDAAVPGLYVAGVAVCTASGVHWYDAGRWPVALAAGDLDGDGDVDLAVALQDEGTAILTNDGTGQFARTAFYETGTGSQAIAAADLNKDGRVDLVVANRFDGTLVRLMNLGSEFRVEPAVLLPAVQPDGEPEVSSEPNALTVVDINNDSWLDVAVACAGDDSVKILTNSFGLLSPAATYPAGPYPVAVAAADLNGDTLADLVVADRESPQVTVLLQQLTGLFVPQDVFLVAVPYGAFTPPTDLTLVYANADRALDIRCGRYALYNDGTGHFGAPDPQSSGPSVYASLRQPAAGWTYLGSYEAGIVSINYISDPTAVPGDINGDGYVNVGDLQALIAAWDSTNTTTPPSSNWNASADLNADGYVNVGDLQVLIQNWGMTAP